MHRTTNRSSLPRRLAPLQTAAFLQGFGLWIAVEKLFMAEIGFTAASVGVMAAAYSVVVPIVELPSGLLADRWSRRAVLIISSAALALSVLVAASSQNVPTYVVSALLLGGYFAMYSGTMEAVVYDTVLEETGESGDYERRIGRVRAIESAALVSGALLGGWIAGVSSPRVTYWLTVPFVLLSIAAYLGFREPTLHQQQRSSSLRSQLRLTWATVSARRTLLPVVALSATTAVLLQLLFEFGPLWLVAISAPAAAFGPYWAGLMTTLGLGGLLATHVAWSSRLVVGALVAVLLLAGSALAVSHHVALITLAQVVIGLGLVAGSVHASHLVHDAVPSDVRAGVASGVGALSWIAFLPVALVFGWITDAAGVFTAAWTVVAGLAVLGALLFRSTCPRRTRWIAPTVHAPTGCSDRAPVSAAA